MPWRAPAIALLLAAAPAHAQGSAPLAFRPAPAPPAPARADQSAVFDRDAADSARQRQDPTYVERIFVEGHDPDAPRAPRKPLERRFADTLLAPPPAPMAGMRMLDTTPCMSLASTWNNIGSSFVPLSGCPR